MGHARLGVGLTTATARTILGSGQTSGRAEQVAQQLGEAIRLGLILDGERLPSEIQLSEQLGIATVTLREALATLRERGLIVTRRGRGGGTFARSPQVELPDSPPLRLLDFSTHDIRELGDHRAAMAAQLAAQRALPEEIANLYRQVERLRAATTASHRRRADTQFTIEVAAAAQSSRLAREELALRAEVGDLLWLERSDADHEVSARSRAELVDAIRRSDPQRSRELAEHHVAADTRRLLAARLELDDPRLHATSRIQRPPSRREVLKRITAQFEQIFVSLDPLAAAFAELAGGTDKARPEGLPKLREIIFEVLNTHNELVAGAGVIAAPDTMRGSRYWLEWWWTRTSGGPEALRVNLDPAAPDFFDYTNADWYLTPMCTSARHVAGPYVDYACTNEYALTVAVPVTIHDRFAGVAAADVLVSNLQRQLLPALRTLSEPAVLLNSGGRVIASSSPQFATGMQVPLPGTPAPAKIPRNSPGQTAARPPIDWHLLPTSGIR
jgi:DNA-binding FadR family transcriptional regulator